MGEAYYRVLCDVEIPGRWFIDDPRLSDGTRQYPWIFTRGQPVSLQGVVALPLAQSGTALDYTEATFGMPVLSQKAAGIVRDLAPREVQLIPACVESQRDPFFIMNVLSVRRCVDERRSAFKKFATNDPVRPDLAGKYDIITKLVLDVTDIGDSQVFRVKDSEHDLIISKTIKDGLEGMRATGLRYWPVLPEGVDIQDFFGS